MKTIFLQIGKKEKIFLQIDKNTVLTRGKITFLITSLCLKKGKCFDFNYSFGSLPYLYIPFRLLDQVYHFSLLICYPYPFNHCGSLNSNTRCIFKVLIQASSNVLTCHHEAHIFLYQKCQAQNFSHFQ